MLQTATLTANRLYEKHVYEWYKMFRSGRDVMEDLPCSGNVYNLS